MPCEITEVYKGKCDVGKFFEPIIWSSFLPDSHSGTYQCARSSVCARLRLACAWHYNVAKEFPSSRILHPLKKWCDYEFTTLNFWNVDFSQAKSSVTSLSGFCLNDDYQQNKIWNMMRKKPKLSIEFPRSIERRRWMILLYSRTQKYSSFNPSYVLFIPKTYPQVSSTQFCVIPAISNRKKS